MKKGSIKLSDINFLDPGLQENPYEAYEVLRKEAPVYLSPDTGFFVVSKYNDLKRVLTDFEFFSRDLSAHHCSHLSASSPTAKRGLNCASIPWSTQSRQLMCLRCQT